MGAWEVVRACSVLPTGGMGVVSSSAVARNGYGRLATRRLSSWTRDYLRKAALADFGCAILGVFVAAQLRFGNDVTGAYVALSLALPVLWLAALWLAGGYDVRFIGTGSDEFRKVLNAGVGLTAALAIFSYAVNLELSRGYVVIALPSVTLFDLSPGTVSASDCTTSAAQAAACSTWWRWAMSGRWPIWSKSFRRDQYHGLTVVGACVARPGETP